jgi:hypothetical protein
MNTAVIWSFFQQHSFRQFKRIISGYEKSIFMKSSMSVVFIFAVFLVAGCSSGIVQMEKNTYMVSEKAGGCGFATTGGQEADAYGKANEFCAKKGLNVEKIELTTKSGIPFARCASADLKFRCVP